MCVCMLCMIHISRIERFVKSSSGRSEHEKKTNNNNERKKKPERNKHVFNKCTHIHTSYDRMQETERKRRARAIVASLALLPTIPHTYIFINAKINPHNKEIKSE